MDKQILVGIGFVAAISLVGYVSINVFYDAKAKQQSRINVAPVAVPKPPTYGPEYGNLEQAQGRTGIAAEENNENDLAVGLAVAAFQTKLINLCVRCTSSNLKQCSYAVSKAQNWDRAQGINNIKSFHNECLPALDILSCADMDAKRMPIACRGQIDYGN